MSFVIFPAIDLRGGKVVRLKQGDPDRMTVYSHDPSATAGRWLRTGACWLHVVDLDGALGGGDAANRSALKAILHAADESGAQVQLGGGLRSLDAIAAALDLGVSRAVLGTIAITQPEVVAQALGRHGADRLSVALDARNGMVHADGWQFESRIPAGELAIRMQAVGVQSLVFTDIDRDGLGSGLNTSSARELADTCGLEVIAAGGVQTMDDVTAARDAGLAGVIIGRALYEGTIHLREALQSAGS
ncbi:MAG TPA: 1-(5-phosphoribosyl)-5-[(5-phosphoribosylamino)methylideneamino]imidazole-4-carboxamide isomerase [Anaerolineales bacterium]|nr:1-(5-phosphoribosyl)-5-[(5-phosphoribosylamino)methylideneamino]imidazole-4-carboxamide isomerase [Anaerolineales bacterium]